MIVGVAGSRGAAFQFVVGTSEVDELSDARLSIFIKARRPPIVASLSENAEP